MPNKLLLIILHDTESNPYNRSWVLSLQFVPMFLAKAINKRTWQVMLKMFQNSKDQFRIRRQNFITPVVKNPIVIRNIR